MAFFEVVSGSLGMPQHAFGPVSGPCSASLALNGRKTPANGPPQRGRTPHVSRARTAPAPPPQEEIVDEMDLYVHIEKQDRALENERLMVPINAFANCEATVLSEDQIAAIASFLALSCASFYPVCPGRCASCESARR